MTLEIVIDDSSPSKPIVLYAIRFARRCLLERLCPTGHSVLNVEHQLVSEAKKELHVFLLQNGCNRSEVERQIRKYAKKHVTALTEDIDIRKTVMEDISSKSLDDAFPVIN